MSRAIEEDRIILHELRGVNVKVDFFLGTREDLIRNTKCVVYSVCWEAIDVRVDLITFTEQISELDFHFNTQQLIIDDHVISGEVIEFSCEAGEQEIINVSCKVLLGRD
jgi:hypothetical protein